MWFWAGRTYISSRYWSVFSLAFSSRHCIVSPSSPSPLSPPQFTGLQSDHLLSGCIHRTAPTSLRHTILPDLVGYMPSTGL